MEIECFQLMYVKVRFRKKKKGSCTIKLTNSDRLELIEKDGIKLSPNHIHKVLRDTWRAPCSFQQNTMNELVIYLGYKDWNDFLLKHPVPPSFQSYTGQLSARAYKELEEKVCRFAEQENLNADQKPKLIQLTIQFPEQ
jgi:hypothetical protein